jgi:hypothetical protein
MHKTGETHIRRHSDGSIDTAFYQAKGRITRSRQVYRLLFPVRKLFQRVLVSVVREVEKGKALVPVSWRRLGPNDLY